MCCCCRIVLLCADEWELQKRLVAHTRSVILKKTLLNRRDRGPRYLFTKQEFVMSVSILEALMSSDHNIRTGLRGNSLSIRAGLSQLHNAIVLLKKGYDSETEVEPLLEKYGSVENVPEFGGTDEKA